VLSSPVRTLVAALVLGIVSAFAMRAFVIDQAPKRVMSTIEDRIVAAAGGWNACSHNQTYGPRRNAARRANPDSIISSMAYDLADGPVRISGETWPRYWSLSFYQQNSDNFFVVNDVELADETFDFVLALDGQSTDALEGEVVRSPTAKGIMLIRRFAADESDMPGIIENQNGMYCAPA